MIDDLYRLDTQLRAAVETEDYETAAVLDENIANTEERLSQVK